MQKILFVCTANIYRSRFSEEVFNHLAMKKNISSRAFSAGLMVGNYTSRKIYYPALKKLKLLNITPLRKDELSIHIDDVKLKDFNKIICMDKNEHQPMVNENKKLKNIEIDYWDIIDEPLVPSNISLPKCFSKVQDLIKNIS